MGEWGRGGGIGGNLVVFAGWWIADGAAARGGWRGCSVGGLSCAEGRRDDGDWQFGRLYTLGGTAIFCSDRSYFIFLKAFLFFSFPFFKKILNTVQHTLTVNTHSLM